MLLAFALLFASKRKRNITKVDTIVDGDNRRKPGKSNPDQIFGQYMIINSMEGRSDICDGVNHTILKMLIAVLVLHLLSVTFVIGAFGFWYIHRSVRIPAKIKLRGDQGHKRMPSELQDVHSFISNL